VSQDTPFFLPTNNGRWILKLFTTDGKADPRMETLALLDLILNYETLTYEHKHAPKHPWVSFAIRGAFLPKYNHHRDQKRTTTIEHPT